MNKNILTGPANCKKTARYHAHTSLCAKYRKTNYAKLRKCRKTSIWAIFWRILRPNISKLQIFLKNRFHSNWKSYLVLTSGEKPKKSWGVFEKNIKVSDFWLIWILFRGYLQIKNFFQKSGSVTNHFSSNSNKNWTFSFLVENLTFSGRVTWVGHDTDLSSKRNISKTTGANYIITNYVFR